MEVMAEVMVEVVDFQELADYFRSVYVALFRIFLQIGILFSWKSAKS
ncbi:hypothetical protein [Paenibacillus alba]|uniref:Uncharacterized protein n=1 Tax=Paenibacillus alba TaxID=1197127 RepID=A0ABU6FUD2_9BACL|nr:hypothetical protein [Paenibacillus alba]MEC0225506.1 hypothetical protein [Paenibacillus alba]